MIDFIKWVMEGVKSQDRAGVFFFGGVIIAYAGYYYLSLLINGLRDEPRWEPKWPDDSEEEDVDNADKIVEAIDRLTEAIKEQTENHERLWTTSEDRIAETEKRNAEFQEEYIRHMDFMKQDTQDLREREAERGAKHDAMNDEINQLNKAHAEKLNKLVELQIEREEADKKNREKYGL